MILLIVQDAALNRQTYPVLMLASFALVVCLYNPGWLPRTLNKVTIKGYILNNRNSLCRNFIKTSYSNPEFPTSS